MENKTNSFLEMGDPSRLYFSYLDYFLFVALLAASALIGLHYGFFAKRKQNNTEEYLLGGKSMKIIPISASLIASNISGITLLGVPSEMYSRGTQYWVFVVSYSLVALAMWFVYLPVFHELQLTSIFTYLELRFDRRVRVTASALFTVSIIIFVPLVVYVPALAFNQTTGINIHLITLITCIICIFYTTVGGLRAVVWTDTLQFVSMVGATVVVIILGLQVTGGIGEVWAAAERGKRLVFFNMDPDPFLRSSFWTISIGLTTLWLSSLGANQGSVQRFLAVADIKKARQSVFIFSFGLIFIKSCCCLVGLIMYAKYESCDPFTLKIVQKVDQVLPYFVMDVATKVPGLPGLFIAGIFSAALSSMSSCWNTLAGTIYEDFFRHRMPNASEKKASNIMKLIVVLLGFTTLALVFVVEKMGAVLTVSISVHGVTAGTLLGIFTFGMIFRQANSTGVITGAIASSVFVAIMMIGAQYARKASNLPFRIDGCPKELLDMANITISSTSNQPDPSEIEPDTTFWLFRISFMYYTFIGVMVVFLVGYPVSILTGGNVVQDERLMTPFLRRKTNLVTLDILQPMDPVKIQAASNGQSEVTYKLKEDDKK